MVPLGISNQKWDRTRLKPWHVLDKDRYFEEILIVNTYFKDFISCSTTEISEKAMKQLGSTSLL